ncbi:MAG: hypothetical protein KKG87_00465, partial [Elusimicrobia bacterium]|nr:hypothetical protein [Elusimicrobiota bacterium]
TIGRQVKEYEKLSSGEVWAQKNNIFASYCKASAYGWLVYLHPEKSSVIPKILVNTDKELLQVTKVYFLIDVITGLSEKLDKQKTFSYDKRNSIWIWQGKNRKNKVLFPNITLGTLKMEGNRLVGETNSLERALRLKQKLENEFKGYLKYEKMESFSQDSLPKPSAEELERMHRENEELNSRPEVQEALRQKLEEHYLTDWVNHRVPALNNLSPQQAAKTDKGKKMLEELISSFEKMQESRPIKVDFNKLRKKLGM